MILSMRSKFFAFFALLVVAGAHAEDVDLENAVRSLIAAEQAYAKLAGEKGFREASISVLADDAVIFAPNAVNGKKFWREAKSDPVISWHPASGKRARSPAREGSALPRITFSAAPEESNHRANRDAPLLHDRP